eukprot:195936-Hanusia_phi.AAC.1
MTDIVTDIKNQLQNIEEDDVKQERHQQAMQLVETLKESYPDIPPSLLYTAAIDYIMQPDMTEEEWQASEERQRVAKEMKERSDSIKGVVYGIE